MTPKLSIIMPVWNQEELVIKALDHIPRRKDIEVLVRDDGSTDKTLANLLEYADSHPELNLTIFANGENKGVAWTKNRLLEDAQGLYFHVHDSDDYCNTEVYSEVIDTLRADGPDIVLYDLIINDGTVYHLSPETERMWPAQIARFVKRKFADGLKFPEDIRAGDDKIFGDYLLARHPVSEYTGKQAYYYNYPREGSLSYLQERGYYPRV